MLEQATDFDRDGYSLFSFPLDRQPFDGSRHPYALDIPGDGIDQDGLGGDFVLLGGRAPARARRHRRPPAQRHPDRARKHPRRRDRTPRRRAAADAGARRARRRNGSAARRAYSHVGFTTNSLQSLFSGKLAPVDDRQSLVRDFLANGYEVGVFSGQAEDFGDTANLVGLRRGAIFVDGTMLKDERSGAFAAQGSVNIDGRILLREFDRRLGRPEAWQRPHFLYFNLQSAHFPYFNPGMDRILPGEPIARGDIDAANRDRVAQTYWNAIAYNDRLIGALIERLRRLGVLDNSIIVVTADHGESLFDDGFLGHGHMLNEQQTRIPFILSAPDVAMPAGDRPRRHARDHPRRGRRRPRRRRAAARSSSSSAASTGRARSARSTAPGGGSSSISSRRRSSTARPAGARVMPICPPAARNAAPPTRLINEWARQRWLRHLEGGLSRPSPALRP